MFDKKAPAKVAEQDERPDMEIDRQNNECSNLQDKPRSAEEIYLARRAEVTEQDHKEFLQYQEQKARQSETEEVRPQTADVAERPPSHVNRRNFLTVVASAAAVGEAGVMAYTIKGEGTPAHGAKHA